MIVEGNLVVSCNATINGNLSVIGTINGTISSTSSGTSIKTTSPVYVGQGNSTTVSGVSVISAYEMIADQVFNIDENTRANYTEENSSTGTDWINGALNSN